MKKNELISIIIASQNRYDELSETLNKIKDQEYKDYEIILVDDGSRDELLRDWVTDNHLAHPWIEPAMSILAEEDPDGGVH